MSFVRPCHAAGRPGWVTRWTADPEKVANALLLTEFDDWETLEAVVPAWAPWERALAYEWALRTHLIAGDNDGIERMPMPDHVRALRKE